MSNLITKEYYNNNKKTIVTYNENGIIHNDQEPAIKFYNGDIQIGHIFVNEGIINNQNQKSAIYIKSEGREIVINSQYGIIHNKDNPAITFKNAEHSYQYYFHKGFIENINGAAIIKKNSKSTIEMFSKRSESVSGFNCNIKLKNKLTTKARLKFNLNSEISLRINESDIENIFDKINLYIDALNIQSENYTYPEEESNIPHIIGFKDNGKIEKLMWLNSKGLHRKDKPALIQFLNNAKVKFYYYEDGKGVEDKFIPHSFVKNRNGAMKILDFEFLDNELQSYYEINKLTPFFMSMKEREEVANTFL